MFEKMRGADQSLVHTEPQPPEHLAAGLLPGRSGRIWVFLLFSAGLFARLFFARFLFLDPDESLHYWVSVQSSLAAAYHATLSTAHPPLFIIFLYYWRSLGHSEVMLRFPGVLAGLAFCWIIYRWIARIAGNKAAEIALPLLLFTPSLIWLSAEVRQYWFLLLFIAIALYCFERAIADQSIGWMIGFTLALDLSLASHYSSLLFALTVGIYGLVRLGSVRGNRKLLVACALGQLSALAEVGFFFKTHISLLKKAGLPREIADTWLRQSIFHASEDHLVPFLLRNTVRFFRYLFGNGIVGAIALAAFAIGVFVIVRARKVGATSGRFVATLVVLPFVIASWTALEGLYPYGGTRHDVFLVPFVILAISIGVSSCRRGRPWLLNTMIFVVLVLANIFPSPAGPFIRPRDQLKSHMEEAIRELRSGPSGSIVFTDYEGGLLLSYYLCDHPAVQPIPPYQPLTSTACGALNVLAESPSGSAIGQQWTFRASHLAQEIQQVRSLYRLPSGTELVMFRAGWSATSDTEFLSVIAKTQGVPFFFGRNILVWKIGAQ